MFMYPAGSITVLINQLKGGDPQAAQQLWERYYPRLVCLARRMLQDTPRRVADEEDVALSAIARFCRAAEQGQFSQLQDRDDLWQLLAVLTVRSALNQIKREQRHKRHHDCAADQAALEQIIGREPTPEVVAQVTEECQRLLDRLGNSELRLIALYKMEGDTTEEIAAKLGLAPRTIERRLWLIRKTWEQEIPP
jgi:RNA polymerase sigma factor (sigma-70 family)